MQPDARSERTITIRLSRDMLLLIAALAFVSIAIVLALTLPRSPAVAPAVTAAAAQPTTALNSTRATALADVGATANIGPAGPSITPAGEPTATPITASLPLASSAGTAYPAPAGQAPEQPTAQANAQLPTAVAAEQPAPTAAVPTFNPSRPTAPSDTSGVFQTTPIATFSQPTPASATATDEPVFDDSTATPERAPTVAIAATAPPPPPPTQPPAPRPTRAPTAVPIDVLRGTVRWTAARSPIVLARDQQLAAGATLIIEPGVEVRLAPGVSLFVDGSLLALGRADQPVRIVGNTSQRWEGIFGRAGSTLIFEHTELRGGGAGGTMLLSERGSLALRNARLTDNGGHVQVNDSRLEVRDSEIAGNDMPYDSAIEASYGGGGGVIMTNNRIGGNRMQAGSAPVRISNLSTFDTVNLELVGNLLVGGEGPDLEISTNGPLRGSLSCNALIGGYNGLSIRSETPQVPGFTITVRDNAIEKHTPPIIPAYLEYGIGRGATSEIALDMRANWWGSPLGPYEPERHADGRGEAVGDNIEFGPWLTERPACAPKQ